jgi:hypothetical protein
MIMLKIRMESWEAQKHPFFKDRLLGNEQLIRLYKLGKLTREDVAAILGTSADYADWLINKWSVDVNTSSKVTDVKPEIPEIPPTTESGSVTEVNIEVSPSNRLPESDIVMK